MGDPEESGEAAGEFLAVAICYPCRPYGTGFLFDPSPALKALGYSCVPSMFDSLGVIVSRRRVIVMLYER